jgi:thiol-disulfide isomerase/thioredoxin
MQLNRRTLSLALLGALAPGALAQAPRPGSPDDPRPRAYSLIGAAAAPFEFPKLGGGQASLRDYHGKALILYFGGLWCPDCVADGAHVNQLAHLASRSRDVAFLNIHTRNRFGRWGGNDPALIDPPAAEAAIRSYFAETGYSYPVAFDASRTYARESYAIEWYPTFLIIDRDGVIREWRTDLGAEGARLFFALARRWGAGDTTAN